MLVAVVVVCVLLVSSVSTLSIDKLRDEIVKQKDQLASNEEISADTTKPKKRNWDNNPLPLVHEHDHESVTFQHNIDALCCGKCPGNVITEYVAKVCTTQEQNVLKLHWLAFKTIVPGATPDNKAQKILCNKMFSETTIEPEAQVNFFGQCGIPPSNYDVRSNLPPKPNDPRFQPHDPVMA